MLGLENFRLTQITVMFKIIAINKIAIAYYISLLRLSLQSTIEWVALTMEIYFLTFLGLEAKINVSIGLVSSEAFLFGWLSNSCLLVVSSHGLSFGCSYPQCVFVCPDFLL